MNIKGNILSLQWKEKKKGKYLIQIEKIKMCKNEKHCVKKEYNSIYIIKKTREKAV